MPCSSSASRADAVRQLSLPALGVAGCGIATAIVMWWQLGAAVLLLRRDPFYRRFGLGRGLDRPERGAAWRRCCGSACRWAWRSWSR